MSEHESASVDGQPLDEDEDLRGPILDDSEDEAASAIGAVEDADPADESDEHKGPRFTTQRLDGDPSDLAQAYDCLRIRTPLEEFETFARARLETLVKLGEAERAQMTAAALETGKGALRHVMGAAQEASS